MTPLRSFVQLCTGDVFIHLIFLLLFTIIKQATEENPQFRNMLASKTRNWSLMFLGHRDLRTLSYYIAFHS